MLILKLGGAAITDKTTPNTPRLDAMRSIAQTLAAHPQPLILVHGAGSFGHIIAQEYALNDGYQGDHQRAALVMLQRSLRTLHGHLLDALYEVGLPALTYQPLAACLMDAGRIVEIALEPIRRSLELGLLPVLYGDCVYDRAKGFGILSGDQLVIYLANALGATRVAFGTNVDGVLDTDGAVIPHIDDLSQVFISAGGNVTDVTGGMRGKLSEIALLQNPQTPAHIFNLDQPENLAHILSGSATIGTLIQQNKG